MKGISKIFVINLERRPDRLQEFFSKAPFDTSDVSIFKAVDGKLVKKSELINKDQKYCGASLSMFNGNDFNYRQGVIGCALSHYMLWSQISEMKQGRYMIFEDDVHYRDNFIKEWETVYDNIPTLSEIPTLDDVNFIYLGGELELKGTKLIKKKFNNNLGYPSHYCLHCTFSYTITPIAAKELKRLCEEYGMKRAVDWAMKDLYISNKFSMYQTIPDLCYSPLSYKTDIQGDFTPITD